MRTRVLLGVALLLALGCGGRKYAPVSGTVTLNGRPLAKAVVTFMPVPEKGSTEAGDSSTGKTNENGEFTLTSSSGKTGALVGKHKVSISLQETKRGESEERERTTELLPKRYNENSDQSYDVKPGDNSPKFELKSP
jgi:hypothetical protein